MKAAVLQAPGVLAVTEKPIPQTSEDEMLVRVRAASICGTDLRVFRHGHFKLPPGRERVLGHEIAGEVAQIGSRVQGFAIGDRVSFTPNVGCGRCRMCLRGLNNMCPDYEAFGITIDGGFQEYMRVPSSAIEHGNVFHFTSSLSFREAALVEPFSCCLRGQQAINVSYNDTVLVIGAGPIGVFNVMLAKIAGARKIIVANRSAPRLGRMSEYGADVLINTSEDDLAEAVLTHTDGLGPDVIVTCASDPGIQTAAVGLLAPHGRLNFFAGLGNARGVEIDTNRVHYKGLSLTGTTGSSNSDYRQALDLVQLGRIDLSSMVTSSFALADINEAFAYSASGAGMKAVVEFDEQ